ncbi:MAG: M1 family metallopeptidase [Bacteroidales bacterium]
MRAKFSTIISILFLLAGCSKSPDYGVSKELSEQRKCEISDVKYTLYMSVPSKKEDRISARAEITFEVKTRQRIILDCRLNDSIIISVTANSQVCSAKLENGHIVIPSKYLYNGTNQVDVDFYAGESSLNRKEDFLYTLLVPDRASTVFPCFDQPDLKAKFNLTLEVPSAWTAIANSPCENMMETDTSKIFMFKPTQPISTYLFAFAAGKFDTISRIDNGRIINLYHRENDSLKVARNLDAIFTSHFHSLNWLEQYTGIDYPFEKLDIVLIPDFQYSGMEHPGAIFYRDSKLFLDENPSESQKLNQANLIAHEVSHQWFGNLVTMRWFNDVWMKEVFAGLMADKIVNPLYPKVNHQLSFLLSHYPRAYSVDRTSGSNPIQQSLDNLLLAGTLYGDIIYHKAPIAMMQLEKSMGSELFQKGIREYLDKYKMDNANWSELIDILDSLSPTNLKEWSKAWIEQTIMPTITVKRDLENHLSLTQKTKGIALPMIYSIAELNDNPLTINHETPQVDIPQITTNEPLQLNSDGLGYGLFVPDSVSLNALANTSIYIKDPVSRASNIIAINELFLNKKIKCSKYFEFLLASLNKEREPLIKNYLLGSIEMVWWKFMSPDDRTKQSQFLEYTLFKLFNSKNITVDERKPIFQTYTRIALSNDAINSLIDFWEGKENIEGISLSEQDLTNLSYELALRNVHESDSILDVQQERIANPDRLAKFRFIRRAVCADEAIRDDFFHSLFIASNRRPEPWVSEALHYFNHPLRSAYSIHYLKASLDLLPEIQQTGDIFFPKMWLDAVLWGQCSKKAKGIVDEWLNNNPTVSDNLKNKLRQSADLLYRTNN